MENRGRGKSLISIFNKINREEKKENDRIGRKVEPVLEIKKVVHFEKEDKIVSQQSKVTDLWLESKPMLNLQRHASIDSQDSTDSDTLTGCICNRNSELIRCDTCGGRYMGRVRRKCYVHQNVIHLMDSISCHHCGACYDN